MEIFKVFYFAELCALKKKGHFLKKCTDSYKQGRSWKFSKSFTLPNCVALKKKAKNSLKAQTVLLKFCALTCQTDKSIDLGAKSQQIAVRILL